MRSRALYKVPVFQMHKATSRLSGYPSIFQPSKNLCLNDFRILGRAEIEF